MRILPSYIDQLESFLTRFAELHIRILPDTILWTIITLTSTTKNHLRTFSDQSESFLAPFTASENLSWHHFLILQNLSWHNCWPNRKDPHSPQLLTEQNPETFADQSGSFRVLFVDQSESFLLLFVDQNLSWYSLLTNQILPSTIRKTRCRHYSSNLRQTLDMLWMYTVKKGLWFSRPQTECHLPNSPWPRII